MKSLDDRLPKESRSQAIGQEGVMAFRSRVPITWRFKDSDGDDDFGIDGQVQVLNSASKVVGFFHVQVKSSETDEPTHNNTQFSISLKVSTLNYYRRLAEPFMLVFSDLREAQDPRDCPVYWVWVNQLLDELLAAEPDLLNVPEATKTLHVPLDNLLTRDTDIVPFLEEFLDRHNSLRYLAQSLESAVGQRTTSVNSVIDQIGDRISNLGSSAIDSLIQEPRGPWLDPKSGSLSEMLKVASEYSKQNSQLLLSLELQKAEEGISLATSHERAEFEFLAGRLSLLNGDYESARERYRVAVMTYAENPKYRLAEIEVCLLLDSTKLEEFVDTIEEVDDEHVSLKGRVLMSLGRHEDANALLTKFQSSNAALQHELIQATVSKRWSRAVGIADQIVSNKPAIHEVVTAQVHKARALVALAMVNDGEDLPDEIPPFGLNGTNFDTLQSAWEVLHKAILLLRERRWPLITEFVVDIWTIAGMVLNKSELVLNVLEEIWRERPYYKNTASCLHKVASFCNQTELALTVVSQLEADGETFFHQFLTKYEAGQLGEVLELAKQQLLQDEVDTSHKLYPVCLGVAATVAQELADPAEEEFISVLRSQSEWAEALAISQFVSRCNRSPIEKDAALEELLAFLKEHPDSSFAQDNLMLYLSPFSQSGDVSWVAEQIQLRRRLRLEEVLHLGQGLMTEQRFDDLEELYERYSSQFSESTDLKSFKAVALDSNGETNLAFEFLRDLLSESTAAKGVLEYFAEMCVRTGRHEEAKVQIRLLLEQSENRTHKLRCLQNLFSIQSALRDQPQQLFDYCWRYGELADQTVEKEEGAFLNMFLMSTLNESVNLSDANKAEFNARVDAFFQNWPESEVIRRIEFPKDASAEEFLGILDQAIGISEEKKLWFEKVANELERDQIPIPFSWRPKKFLRNVSDLCHLLYLTRNSSIDDRAFKFTICSNEASYGQLPLPQNAIPIFDTLTLLVLYELGLLQYLPNCFQRLVIPRLTITELQTLAHQYMGGHAEAREVMSFLEEHVDILIQPATPVVDGEEIEDSLQEIEALLSSNEFMPFLDDQYARLFCTESLEPPFIHTVMFARELERIGLLPAELVADKLTQLAEWGIGIWVELRYLVATIPAHLLTTNSMAEVSAELRSSRFNALACALWDIRLPYQNVINHGAGVAGSISRFYPESSALVAAIVDLWLQRVRFRKDLKGDPSIYLANCFVLAATDADTTNDSARCLWSAYIYVVEEMYGDKMDQDVDKLSRATLGQVAADLSLKEESRRVGEAAFANLLTGLTPETADYDCFNQAYQGRKQSKLQDQKLDS